jgi:hypothetical protein
MPLSMILPIHGAQLLKYLKLGGWNTALMINFNVRLLKQGIRRRVFHLQGTRTLLTSAVNF